MSKHPKIESPEYAKISHATAISLGLARGRMYRGAVNRCVNLLVHYPEGCSANCAYCGLAKKRPGAYEEKSFIHVGWPVLSMDRIIQAIREAPAYVGRTCISMITNGKCRGATLDMTRRLTSETALPVSLLVAPTVMKKHDPADMKAAGADKIGVALDLATPDLFDQYRGSGVSGPHKWDTYVETIVRAIDIFGPRNVGAHLMVGMGETEEQMARLMDRLFRMGAVSHLFSFFAEENSRLADRPQPPWPSYLRVQLARYLLEEELSVIENMAFDPQGRIVDFGVSPEALDSVVGMGVPFMTTGCLGPDGEVACNRPFGNCLPDVKQWNYPYGPNTEELDLIRKSLSE
ncbi:MAG: radical SAM protein [Deltaproteobacteria bacterium]|nr:radical SAM protein [Deltaproteobacteria bacterium]